MTTTPDALEAIFAYRIVDLSDRCPGPVTTFGNALAFERYSHRGCVREPRSDIFGR